MRIVGLDFWRRECALAGFASGLGVVALLALLPAASRLHAEPAASAAAAAPQPAVDFAHDVLPLLRAKCSRCHTGDEPRGGVSFNTRAELIESAAVVPGKSGESDFIARVASDDPETRMPPDGQPLKAEQVALLARWVDAGAPWTDEVTLVEVRPTLPLGLTRPVLPPARDGREHPVDRIVDQYLAAHNAEFPPATDDAAFARRVSLDLTGLLPAPAELQAFLDDPSADRRERFVDALLARDRAYAEHWLTFWNDLLRNDYAGTGVIEDGRKQITGWLYGALLANKPYDQFVTELIAPTAESEGFIRGIKWRGNANASQAVEMQFAQNVGQVFLGINLKCASCHDSFVDSWKLTDSYGLAAIVAEQPLEIHRCDVPTGETAAAGFLFPELGSIDASASRDERLRQLAALLTDRGNGRLPRTLVNRLWFSLMGRGIVHPVDAMGDEPFSRELLDYLASELVDNGYDVKKLLRTIVTSRIYQAQCSEAPDESDMATAVFRGPLARHMSAEQFLDAVYRITGCPPEKAGADFGDRGNEPVRAALATCDLLMRSLGRPNREQVVTSRPNDLSTLQALDLTNGPALAELLERGAAKRMAESNAGADALVGELFLATLCREPTADEARLAREILGQSPSQQGLVDLYWCVLMLPEFQMIH